MSVCCSSLVIPFVELESRVGKQKSNRNFHSVLCFWEIINNLMVICSCASSWLVINLIRRLNCHQIIFKSNNTQTSLITDVRFTLNRSSENNFYLNFFLKNFKGDQLLNVIIRNSILLHSHEKFIHKVGNVIIFKNLQRRKWWMAISTKKNIHLDITISNFSIFLSCSFQFSQL